MPALPEILPHTFTYRTYALCKGAARWNPAMLMDGHPTLEKAIEYAEKQFEAHPEYVKIEVRREHTQVAYFHSR